MTDRDLIHTLGQTLTVLWFDAKPEHKLLIDRAVEGYAHYCLKGMDFGSDIQDVEAKS